MFGLTGDLKTREVLERERIGRREGVRIENLRGPFDVRFVELENGTLAHIDEHMRIFFPQNFRPNLGQDYRGYYVQTLTGIYVYRGVQHRVCRVYLADETVCTTDSYLGSKVKGESPFAAALRGFRTVEKYTVFAKTDPKGRVRLSPVYQDADPAFDNEPTMYLFSPPRSCALEENREYRIQVISKVSTGRINCRGALMIDVSVSVISS